MARRVIACAGLQSDRVAAMTGDADARSASHRALQGRLLHARARRPATSFAASSTRSPTRASRSSACTSRSASTARSWPARTPCWPRLAKATGAATSPRATSPGRSPTPVSCAWPGATGAWARRRCGATGRVAPSWPTSGASCRPSQASTCDPGPRGCAPRRSVATAARRRLPAGGLRPRAPRPERAVAGRDLVARHRPRAGRQGHRALRALTRPAWTRRPPADPAAGQRVRFGQQQPQRTRGRDMTWESQGPAQPQVSALEWSARPWQAPPGYPPSRTRLSATRRAPTSGLPARRLPAVPAAGRRVPTAAPRLPAARRRCGSRLRHSRWRPDAYPVNVSYDRPRPSTASGASRSSAGLVRAILVIPHFLILWLLAIVAAIAAPDLDPGPAPGTLPGLGLPLDRRASSAGASACRPTSAC